MLALKDISHERKQKLASMMTDRIREECELFWEQVRVSFPELSAEDRAKLSDALEFNLGQNYGPRPLDRFYGVHPVRVARFLAGGLDPSSPRAFSALVAALLHNAVEKKILSPEALAEKYGRWVAHAVQILTPDRAKTATPEGLREYYAGIQAADPEVRMLKALDKFDNTFSLCLNPDGDVRTKYIDELRVYVRPLLVKDLPALVSYYDELVTDAERLGHYVPMG